MKGKVKIYILIFLNAIFLLTILWSIMIYTSLLSEKLPWYEPCGMQFFAILILCCPTFIVIGIIEILFDKFLVTSKPLKFLPFICSLGMGLPILIDGTLGIEMQIIGASIGLFSVVSTIYFTIQNVKLISKKSTHANTHSGA
jgi:hypothetical protein